MATFKQYINEILHLGTSGEGQDFYEMPRSKNIEREQAIKLIKANCKKTMKTQRWLYRETKKYGDFVISDPTVGVRYSRNTSNFITMSMSNLPSWSKYPKRTKCLVCSTGRSGAYSYGHFENTKYVVLPYDKCTIGVAPSQDIFASFKKLTYSVPTFNNSIQRFAKKYGIKIDDTSWSSIKSGLESLAAKWNIGDGEEMGYPTDNKSSEKMRYITDVINSWREAGGKQTFMDFFNDFLSPRKNEFSLYKAGDSGIPTEEKEAWVGGGKCVLVSFFAFEYFKEIGLI